MSSNMPKQRNARAERKAASQPGAKSFFGSRTEVGHVREHNEDSLVVTPPLFAVADGMGGHEAGEVASEIAIKTLAELAPEGPDGEALARAVVAANLEVIKAPGQGIGREGMGTTLTAAILEGERLVIAQVGDSRAYLMHQGRLQQLTRDHSLMADMIEAGQLTEAEARVHPNRSVITRAIGSDPHMQPDIYELNVETGDRILLCSDGVTTMLEDPEIARIMGSSETAQECADSLVAGALDAGGYDNATAIVMDVEGFRVVRERKEKRKSRAFYAFLVAMLIAIFAAAGFAAYQYVYNSAYLINQDGKVAVYRGLHEELLGMPLSSLDRVTDVDVSKLQPSVATRLNDGISAGSMDEANEIIASYEEEVARQDAATKTTAQSAGSSTAATGSSATTNSSTTNSSNSASAQTGTKSTKTSNGNE